MTFGYLWWYLGTSGDIWVLLVTFGYFWWHVHNIRDIWVLLVTFRYFWLYLGTFSDYGDLWVLLVTLGTFGDNWWVFVTFGYFWWHLVTFSLHLVTFWLHLVKLVDNWNYTGSQLNLFSQPNVIRCHTHQKYPTVIKSTIMSSKVQIFIK